jgi:hypothetical protein
MAGHERKILPHGELEELVPGLWSVTGSLPIPLRRNMTVFRLGDGTLLLHSVVAMKPDGMGKLDALGKPSVMIVPSTGHRMDATFYKERYPDMRVLAPAAARTKVEQVIPVDATCEEALPPLGMRVHPLGSLRTGEMVYELSVAGGRALMFCDALANRDHPPGFGGAFFANVTGGIKGRLGVARIVKWTLIKDKAAMKREIGALADIPDLAVLTVGHGRPVRERCADAIREAAASI